MRPTKSVLALTPRGLLRRRTIAALFFAAPALWSGAYAQAGRRSRATPAQTEGPFYPVALPADSDNDLLRNGALDYPAGEVVWLEGRVSDLAGRPLAGAQVEIWQCDHAGHYHHPGDGAQADPRFQGFGRCTVAADGAYRFRTIRPVPYTGRTPHIHVKVKVDGRELLTTQVYVAGEPRNERDFLWRALSAADREAVTVPFVQGKDGVHAVFPITVVA